MLLSLSAEVRLIIYRHLFQQPDRRLLGLSREAPHDYDSGPPSDWIADSRQKGLVYGSDTARVKPTNSRFLRTCRLIHHEASPVFYGANNIVLYAEDNNDVFYWLLDIGEGNRRAIRDLEIGWAYGVAIEAGRGNIHAILQNIEDMQGSHEKEIQKQREQLISVVQQLEQKTVRLIIRTLSLLVANQDLNSLAVYLPGVDGGDIWDLPNESFYFAEEIFSNSTNNVYACIPKALGKMTGVKKLTIGYTKDIGLAEKVARTAGAYELIIQTRPEGQSLDLDKEERAEWLEHGWRLEGKTAYKLLFVEAPEEQDSPSQEHRSNGQKHNKGVKREEVLHNDYSEGGRLKALMMVN